VGGVCRSEEGKGRGRQGAQVGECVQHSNVYFLALSKRNSNAATVLAFLTSLTEVMTDYFGRLEEESIRDNFVLVYELLDETIDFGYPQYTEASVLKQYITQEGSQLKREAVKPPQAVTNVVSWRPEGIVHKKNEVFLDVVEKVNLLVASTGRVLSSEIVGSIRMRCQLSGMPELKLGLNDKVLFEATGRSRRRAVELEDVKFHQCVRLHKFESDRTISFIPPDGAFELMSYRLDTAVKPLIWVEAVVEQRGRSRLEYMVRAKSHFKGRWVANNVEILIPVPPDVDTPSFKAAVGAVTYMPDSDCIKWSIRQFYGSKDFLMQAHFGLPSVAAPDTDEEASDSAVWKRPIRVKFEIPHFTVSGIAVRYVRVVEKSGYSAHPWVRYVTQNGDYQLRFG
jgi:AP-1 complex subunit mu